MVQQKTSTETRSADPEKAVIRLTELMTKARRYAESDPEVALGQAYQAAETICLSLFAREIGKPEVMMLDELMKKLQTAGVIPTSVVIPLETVRMYGNFGANARLVHDPISPEWITPCLFALDQVTHWYFVHYLGVAVPEALVGRGAAEPVFKETSDAPTAPLENSLIGGRYRDLGDGTVLDTETDLQWMRCALGQRWDGSTCVDEADGLTWDRMFVEVDVLNKQGGFAGHRDWRVPTVDELKTLIIEGRHPAIDELAFPKIPKDWQFWSSSPSPHYSGDAWYVYFYYGDVSNDHKFLTKYVRLVRAGQ